MNRARLNRLSDAAVLVVGDVMLDRYLMGDTERISPEAPVPVVRVSRTEDRAGGAANVARNIAHLQGRVGLLGVIGADAEGELLQGILREEGIHSELIVEPSVRTIAKTRIISRHQQVVRLDVEERLPISHGQTVATRCRDRLQNWNTLIVSDYNKGALSEVSRLIADARRAGLTVLVDPKQQDFSVYRGAQVITPNLSEFRAAGGQTTDEAAMLASARVLLKNAGIEAMLLTRSEHGMSLITAQEHHHFPAEVLEVSDVTGAGDTVIATLATALSAGLTLVEAAWLSNLAAGIVVSKLGAATVTPQELQARIQRQQFAGRAEGALSPEQAMQAIEAARSRGERIVFTNGCFDILHAGHVRYLAQARALGDRLVVGLNSDASVRRLKGEGRPVNTLEDRAEVLQALACVDWVIPFGDVPEENDTPALLIEQVQPKVLAKGGDYRADGIVGADFVRAGGGEVVVLTLVEGRSTTGIINKVRG